MSDWTKELAKIAITIMIAGGATYAGFASPAQQAEQGAATFARQCWDMLTECNEQLQACRERQ